MSAHSQSHATKNAPLCPTEVIIDLRTDHAGKTGALYIYQAVLQFARDQGVRAFAARHLEIEAAHLRQIKAWLPQTDHSLLLPIWRLAGWLTGAIPAMLGPQAVYATVRAVETFVDQHYAEQVHRLESYAHLRSLRQTLLTCQADVDFTRFRRHISTSSYRTFATVRNCPLWIAIHKGQQQLLADDRFSAASLLQLADLDRSARGNNKPVADIGLINPNSPQRSHPDSVYPANFSEPVRGWC